MGIVTWIKNKYYDSRFQKASRLLSENDVNGAVEILIEILDKHIDAPSTLLSIYHQQIAAGDFNRIKDTTRLLGNFGKLKTECIDFANTISRNSNVVLAIDYIQSIFCAGVQEVKTLFVDTAQHYILSTPSITNLKSLTGATSLISTLSESLYAQATKFYNNKDFSVCNRLCELILPVIKTKEFYYFYINVQFDTLALNKIDEQSIVKLDKLFNDAKNIYNLSDSKIKSLKDRGLGLAQKSFDNNDYLASLLISQRLIEYATKACKIYVDSALNLCKSSATNRVIPECLYKALGNSPKDLVIGLEPFIPYHKSFLDKYLDAALSELKRLINLNREQAENIFFHVWSLKPDSRLIDSVLSNGPEKERIFVATRIIDNDSYVLTDESNLSQFLKCLKTFTDIDFVVDSLERLLKQGRKVDATYEWAILKQAKSAPNNSRKRIEIISRGLHNITPQSLFNQKAKYLKDYIVSGRYDKAYSIREVASLIGRDGLADVLSAQILLDEAKDSQDNDIKEKKLREALSLRKSHNQPFDKSCYDTLIPEIAGQVTQLAKDLYSKDVNKAKSLLYLLKDNNLSWYETYASLFLDSISNTSPSSELVSSILNVIKEGSSSDILTTLWSRYLNVSLSVSSSLSTNEAIDYLETTYTVINESCSASNKSDLIKSVNTDRSKLLMARGKRAEKNKMYENAIHDYECITSIIGEFSDIKTRIYICKIKNGSKLSKTDIEVISSLLRIKKNKPYQKDLAFRWCIYLISNNELIAADEINKRILDCDPEITQICQEEKIKSQQKILDRLNEQIEKLNNSTLSANEAVSFGKTISKTIEDISFIAPITPQKIKIIKESIRVLAIEKFFEEGDYLNSMKGLKVHDSTYLSDPILLRNIAIMALLAVEDGHITETNYKELLAIWATAIYQQRLFVDSLDYTTWDDPYTFSLHDALGLLDDQDDDLPENVNYDYPDGSNVVSILEVQRNLLIRMETAIQEKLEYQNFLNSQVAAMNKLASQNLDEKCVIVAPYLLNLSNSYKEDVFSSLRAEASQNYDNWEDILEIGCIYGLKEGDFILYDKASEYLKVAQNSITRRNQISRVFTPIKLSKIKKFPGLMSQLTSSVMTAINADISQEFEYTNLYNIYGQVVKIIEDDSIAFKFSNYVNQQIVRNLNDKNISLAAGAKILFDIYSYCKCNPHLKRNLTNITEALIHNYITDGDDDNVTVLESALSSNRDFDNSVVNALKGGDGVPEEMIALLFSSNESRFNNLKLRLSSKSSIIQTQFAATSKKISDLKVQLELSEIVDKVNNDSMSKCDALQKVYDIYRNNKSNVRVCENLASLIPMCIMEYIIPGKIGQQKVTNVLNALKSNMSSTYKAHASSVREAYDMIWNSLSMENKMALQGSSIYGLNENGLRLKKGLDYLRTLR